MTNNNIFLHILVLSIAGKANLEKSDLEPALKALKDRLMTKNVVCIYRQHRCLLPLACLSGYTLATVCSYQTG